MEKFLLRPIGFCSVFLIVTAEKILRITLNLFKFCCFLDLTRACAKKILIDLAMLIGGNASFIFRWVLIDWVYTENVVKRAVNMYIRCAYVQSSKE